MLDYNTFFIQDFKQNIDFIKNKRRKQRHIQTIDLSIHRPNQHIDNFNVFFKKKH